MNYDNRVNILMAIYKPNFVYLEKQLESLNSQTYKDLLISIIDDSADENMSKKIKKTIEMKLDKVNFEFFVNDFNIGSNKTFEKLTLNSQSKYIAYCDQDDIWEENKIEKLVNEIQKKKSIIVYSDLSIIDSSDNLINSSFKNINPRLNHVYGKNAFEYFLTRNSITGCTLLMESKVAKKHLPFMHDYFVHDHWLALISASEGEVSYINEPLIKYRLHENNQIGSSILKDINNKTDYNNNKIKREISKFSALEKYEKFSLEQKRIVKKKKETFLNKKAYLEQPTIINFLKVIKWNNRDYKLLFFEIFIGVFPNKIVEIMLKKIKNKY